MHRSSIFKHHARLRLPLFSVVAGLLLPLGGLVAQPLPPAPPQGGEAPAQTPAPGASPEELREQYRQSQATSPATSVDLDSPRTFTDARGQAVTGTLREVAAGGIVVIDTAAKSQVRARLQDLSLEDQNYVETWYLQKVVSKGRSFQITAQRQTPKRMEAPATSQTRGFGSSAPETSLQSAGYDVTVRNTAALPLKGLTIQYRLYKKGDSQGAVPPAPPQGGTPPPGGFPPPPQPPQGGPGTPPAGPPQPDYTQGEVPKPVWNAGEAVEFATEPITLKSTEADSIETTDPDGRTTKTRIPATKERLTGIWVRVQQGNTVLSEFADPKSLVERESWPVGEAAPANAAAQPSPAGAPPAGGGFPPLPQTPPGPAR